VLWTTLAVIASVATACCSVVAGMVERDDSEEAGEMAVAGSQAENLTIPLVAAGILAVGGFGAPSIVSPEYVEATLWPDFGTPSWGLLLALCTVLGVCFLAPRSRPVQAAALLGGAACLALLRAAEYPLAAGQITGANAGLGWWLALATALALLIAAVMAVRVKFHSTKPRAGSLR
jgi:hypothetical protein